MGSGQSAEARAQEEIDQLLESALCDGKKPEWCNEDSLRSPKALADSLRTSGVESSNLICASELSATRTLCQLICRHRSADS